MSIIAARFIDFTDRYGTATTDTFVEVFTDLGEIRTFNKASLDTEWQRYLATNGYIADINGSYGPELTSLTPNTAETGSPVTVQLTGTGFSEASQIMRDGEMVGTTYVSDTELNTDVPATGIAGTTDFWVVDRRLESQHMTFTFTDPVIPLE